jgi:hypothetical protein
MYLYNYLFVAFLACIPAVASADDYFSTGTPDSSGPECMQTTDKPADLDAVVNGDERPARAYELPPDLGIDSAYDVINNWRNVRIISNWLNEKEDVVSGVQEVRKILQHFFGSRDPGIRNTVEVSLSDGSEVKMEAVFKRITTAEGTNLVIEFEPLWGVDTDRNRVHLDGQSFAGQSGVVSGGNISRLNTYLRRHDFTVHTQGDDGDDDLVCDWSCSALSTCNFNCTSATE